MTRLLPLALLALLSTAAAIEVPFTVLRVRDGRTLDVRLGGGQVSTLRLAGIASSADTAALAHLAPKGTRGWFASDGRRHPAGQGVGFVFLGASKTGAKRHLNLELLRRGAARLNPADALNDFAAPFRAAQEQARAQGRGVWAK